jgi:hypothetical protein
MPCCPRRVARSGPIDKRRQADVRCALRSETPRAIRPRQATPNAELPSACRTGARCGLPLARGGREDRSRQGSLLGMLGVGPGSGAITVRSWACCSELVHLGPGTKAGCTTSGCGWLGGVWPPSCRLRGQRHQHRPATLNPGAGDGPRHSEGPQAERRVTAAAPVSESRATYPFRPALPYRRTHAAIVGNQ